MESNITLIDNMSIPREYSEEYPKSYINAVEQMNVQDQDALYKYSQNDKNFIKIVIMVAELTKDYDSSHDMSHFVRVAASALIIHDSAEWENSAASGFTFEQERKIICYSCLLHDTIDEKYILTKQRMQFVQDTVYNCLSIYCTVNERLAIFEIINNISLSSEIKNKCIPNLGLKQVMWLCVSDADKKDSLRVQRCIDFQQNYITKNKDGINNLEKYIKLGWTKEQYLYSTVAWHCVNKFVCLSEKYLHTKRGKEIARDMQLECNQHTDKLLQYLKEQLNRPLIESQPKRISDKK